jgi:hypothetical protein
MSAIRWRGYSFAIFAVALAIVGCAATSATTTGSPSPTGAQVATGCAATPGFAEAKAATAGPRFTDVSFPAGAVGYSSIEPEANGFQFQLTHICVAGSGPEAARSFLSADLPGHGWVSQDTAPITGDLSTPCAIKPLCFAKNDGALRYVVVQEIVPGAGLTIYTLRLIIQPLLTGSALLASGQTLDLDPTGPAGPTATPSANPSASPTARVADLTWTGAQLAPAGGAKVKAIGAKASLNAVTYADLAGLTYETTPLNTSALTTGAIIAIETADSHYAKAQVKSTTGGLSLDYVTYAYTF